MNNRTTKNIGDIGEKYARRYLQLRFYKILDLQYSTPFGEIDIIAQKKNTIIFVEVKSRTENYKTPPAEAVTKAKQDRVIKTACSYMKRNNIKLQPRFDIIEVILDSQNMKKIKLNHISNAFARSGYYAVF